MVSPNEAELQLSICISFMYYAWYLAHCNVNESVAQFILSLDVMNMFKSVPFSSNLSTSLSLVLLFLYLFSLHFIFAQ